MSTCDNRAAAAAADSLNSRASYAVNRQIADTVDAAGASSSTSLDDHEMLRCLATLDVDGGVIVFAARLTAASWQVNAPAAPMMI